MEKALKKIQVLFAVDPIVIKMGVVNFKQAVQIFWICFFTLKHQTKKENFDFQNVTHHKNVNKVAIYKC